MVRDEYVDVLGRSSHYVNSRTTADEAVRGVRVRIDRGLQLVPESFECGRGCCRDASAGLDMEDDVDVVGGTQDA